LAVVVRGDLAVTVNEEGMTRVKNRYVIASPVAGQLRRIDWKPGALVEAGKTVLAVLESGGADLLDARSLAQAEARVRAAEAAVAQAAAQRARAGANAKMQREDLVRQKTLFSAGTLSRQEFDGAEMRATTTAQDERAAEFAGQIAEFELAQARALLLRGQPAGAGARGEPLVITSPVSGRVLRVFQRASGWSQRVSRCSRWVIRRIWRRASKCSRVTGWRSSRARGCGLSGGAVRWR